MKTLNDMRFKLHPSDAEHTDKASPAGYNVFFDYQFINEWPKRMKPPDKYGFGSYLNHREVGKSRRH